MASRSALHTVELGESGGTLVFLPGMGGTTRYWRAGAESLAGSHRVLLVDLLGFGQSPKPWTRYTVARHVEALRCVLEERGPLTLVGHSLGAVLAVAYAARWRGQVERLVLLGMPYFGGRARAIRHFRQAGGAGRWLHTNMLVAAMACVLTRRVFGRLLPRLLPGMPREVAEDLTEHTWLSSTTSVWEVVYGHDLARDAGLLGFSVPVLCLHGDRDRTAPLAGISELAEGRDSWRVQVLAGVGHHPWLRAPETCLRAIVADDR